MLKRLMEKYQAENARRAGSQDGGGRPVARSAAADVYLERRDGRRLGKPARQRDREIPVSEELGYYQQHIADFEFPAKAAGKS